MMRILHVEKQHRMSGQTKRVLLAAVGLRERGHEVALLCPSHSALGREARSAGLAVFHLGMSGVRLYLGTRAVRRFARQNHFDIVHAHGSRDHLLAALALVGAKRPVLVRTKHNQVPLHRGVFSRWVYGRLTSHLIAVSEAVRDGLVRDGLPSENISIVRDGVDTHRFRPGPKSERVMEEFRLRHEHIVVGAAGRFGSGSMNSETLAEAMHRVAQRMLRVRFLLPGRGNERLRARVDALGLTDRAFLPGFREDMPDLFSVMDIFVQPNVKAALGTALLEAQAAGKPVVATRVGGHPEAVRDGETGLLCPPRDPVALAEAILRLAADEALRRRMGRWAREHIEERFSGERMVRELEALYRGLLDRRPRGASARVG